VIVGAGYIGLELAFVYARLGTRVTVIEMLEEQLPGFDAELARVVRKRALEHDTEFAFGETAGEWRSDGDGIVVATEAEDGVITRRRGDPVLVAVGRDPVTDTVDLRNAGIETTECGFSDLDADRRTLSDHLYAVGDVAGESMLANKASREGLLVAEAIAGNEGPPLDLGPVPAVVYIELQIAMVGATPDEWTEAGHSVLTGEFSLVASGRALAASKSDGFVRIVGDVDDGRIVGGQVVSSEAAELLNEFTVAMHTDLTLSAVVYAIHPHPTFSETIMEAAADTLGRSVHVLQ